MASGNVNSTAKISGSISGIGTISGSLNLDGYTSAAPYEGPYEFTPSDTAQTIEITGKRGLADITINAIPSNYGKISYNGVTLTVS